MYIYSKVYIILYICSIIADEHLHEVAMMPLIARTKKSMPICTPWPCITPAKWVPCPSLIKHDNGNCIIYSGFSR